MAVKVNSFQMKEATEVLSFLDLVKQSPPLTHLSFIITVLDFHSLKYNEGMSGFVWSRVRRLDCCHEHIITPDMKSMVFWGL